MKAQKPDIEYPKTIFVVPFDYESYRDGDDDTELDDLSVHINLDDAEAASGGDEEVEVWIAVYQLKELVKVEQEIAVRIKDRYEVKK